MYFLQDLINKSYNLWGGGCRKHTPPTYHTANSIPQHAKRENRKILNGGQHKMLKISHLPRIMIRMKRKGKAAVGGRVYQRSVCRYHEARYLTSQKFSLFLQTQPDFAVKSLTSCLCLRNIRHFLCFQIHLSEIMSNGNKKPQMY